MKHMKKVKKSLFGRSSKRDEVPNPLSAASIIDATKSPTPVPSPSSVVPDGTFIVPESSGVATQAIPSDSTGTKSPNEGSASDAPSETSAGVSTSLKDHPGLQTAQQLSELDKALDHFEKNCKQFSKKYILIDDDLENLFQSGNKGDDLKHMAKIFGDNVSTTIKAVEKKQTITQGKWTNQVGQFLIKLYPVASLACGLTAAAADVFPV